MKKLNTSGAAAMMTVVFFALIITIVTTVYMRTIVSQVKNSLTYDLGTRAYYSAESGVQDAARALANGVPSSLMASGQNTCKTSSGAYLGGTGQFTSSLGYSCQIVETTPQSIDGSVSPNPSPNSQSALMRLEPATASASDQVHKIVIRWAKPEHGGVSRNDANKSFSPLSNWNFYALLRASVIDLPRSGTINRTAITQRAIFLNPASSASSGTVTMDKNAAQLQRDVVGDGKCYNGVNAETGDYRCKMTIDLRNYNLSSTGRQLYLQLGALYRTADFSVSMERCSSSGTSCAVIPLQGVQAHIDVTGRANNVYRRVRQTVPIKGGYTTSTWMDAAIVAGEGICKNFEVGTAANQFEPECNPNDP